MADSIHAEGLAKAKGNTLGSVPRIELSCVRLKEGGHDEYYLDHHIRGRDAHC
jgi:hypothetical protein